MSSNEDLLQTKMEAKLDQVDADIRKWKAEARERRADAGLDVNEWISKLENRRDEARKKLEAYRDSGSEGADQLRKGVESAWDDLSSSVKAAWDAVKS